MSKQSDVVKRWLSGDSDASTEGRRRRRARAWKVVAAGVALGILALAAAGSLFLDPVVVERFFRQDPNAFFALALAFTGTALVSASILFYLRPSDVGAWSADPANSYPFPVEEGGEFEDREWQASAFAEELVPSSEFTSADRRAVSAAIASKIEAQGAKDYLNSLRSAVKSELDLKQISMQITRTRTRLRSEISDLGRRGNINLVLGMLAAIVGTGTLAFFVATLPVTSDLHLVLGQFFPRFSLVVVIELFAFFFLRLYKQSLSEIKYFQNELTNLESKYIAMNLALRSSDQELTHSVAMTLAATERNPPDLGVAAPITTPDDLRLLHSITSLVEGIKGKAPAG